MTTPAANGRMPLVSAIIVFLDEADFLEEAIQSVIDQSYPHWELILVDDGSPTPAPISRKSSPPINQTECATSITKVTRTVA